jgi:uncharacterized protein
MTGNVATPDLSEHGDLSAASDSPVAMLTFVALTFGWTWGLWALPALLPEGSAGWATAALLASAFGPSLAGIAVVALFDGRQGMGRWWRRCLRWRLGWRWYALACLAPLAAMALALALLAAAGGDLPPSPAAGHLWMSLVVVAQITVLGGPLGEEFGWRGYALPALARRLGWRWASLIVGVVWGVWHLPLFWMPGMAQASLPVVPFLGGTIALSVIFARLSVNTGFSVLPAIVLHAAINAGSWAIPVTPQGGETGPYLIVMGLVFVIAIIVFFKPGLYPPPEGPHQ